MRTLELSSASFPLANWTAFPNAELSAVLDLLSDSQQPSQLKRIELKSVELKRTVRLRQAGAMSVSRNQKQLIPCRRWAAILGLHHRKVLTTNFFQWWYSKVMVPPLSATGQLVGTRRPP